MTNIKHPGVLVAGALLGALTAAAVAQQAPTPPAEKPPMTSPDVTTPSPTPPMQKPAATPPADAASLVGLTAFSSDGTNVGDVRAVKTAPDGKIALHVRTGGFLGFGTRLVAIPDGRYTKSGQNVRLTLTADEVSKLPQIKDEG